MPKLFCVPLLVKDNYDTVGMAATNGAYGLLDNIPAQDAYQVSSSKLQNYTFFETWLCTVEAQRGPAMQQWCNPW